LPQLTKWIGLTVLLLSGGVAVRIGSWLLVLVVLFSVALTAGAAVFAYVTVRDFVVNSPVAFPTLASLGSGVASIPTNVLSPTASSTRPAPTNTALPTATTALSTASGVAATLAPALPATVAVTLAPTQSPTADLALLVPTRVTILVMGTDHRHGETGPANTDTMIVMSIDPIRKTAAMISIPRDTFMQIPGFTADRINTAMSRGISVDYPGGGGKLSAKTASALLGIPIQHYFVLNFDVFYAVIDAIGPIQVCPPTAIHDANYPDGSYGIITVDFPAGCQNLDGVKLLQYSRVRHNAGDDFGRASRQQEVIRAARDKILSLGGLTALISKAGPLWTTVQTSVQTDMTFDQMIQLGQVGLTIPKENVSSVVLSDRGGYYLDSKTPDGQDVLSPIYENIHKLVGQMFDAPPGKPITDQSISVTPTGAPAVIQVANGSGVNGLAAQVTTNLRNRGFTVLDPKNADTLGGYAKTVIRVYTGNFDSARRLAQVLGVDASAIIPGTGGAPGVDIDVVLGADAGPTVTPAS
jgi:LCP family protein required for cell wall assembly